MMNASLCYCGNPLAYSQCCKPFHDGTQNPETAEKLMRSRYSAYVVGKIDYVADTNDPASNKGFDREAAEAWSKKSEWLGLEIVATKQGQATDSSGEVEFKATFKTDGEEQVHHEVSLFHRNVKTSKWHYVDGKDIREPLRRSEKQLGRNDPCHCGSGKKFKKCCG